MKDDTAQGCMWHSSAKCLFLPNDIVVPCWVHACISCVGTCGSNLPSLSMYMLCTAMESSVADTVPPPPQHSHYLMRVCQCVPLLGKTTHTGGHIFVRFRRRDSVLIKLDLCLFQGILCNGLNPLNGALFWGLGMLIGERRDYEWVISWSRSCSL